jgi:hypothetical protein
MLNPGGAPKLRAAKIAETKNCKPNLRKGLKTKVRKGETEEGTATASGATASRASAPSLPCLRRVVLAHVVQQRAKTLHHQEQVRHAEWDFKRCP